MAQSKILIDTNAYLRLAQSIKPLLFTPFGVEEYCLYVIPELNDELNKRHLKNAFPWIDDPEYSNYRQHFPKISRNQKKSIQSTFEYLWDHVVTELPGPSRVDVRYIAYTIELGIVVVTDDEDMIQLANAFDAKVMRTLDLLKLMLDAGHIDMPKIRTIVSYWRYIKDTPGQLDKRFRKIFGCEPP